MKKEIMMIVKRERPLIDIWHFILGNVRYKLYYSADFNWLMRDHITEQIAMRIRSMDKQCYMQGQCKMCGCQTTHLQMSNKACDKPCYPEMMNKEDWKVFSRGKGYIDQHGHWFKSASDKFLHLSHPTN